MISPTSKYVTSSLSANTIKLLRQNGIARIGVLENAASVIRHLQASPVYPGHVKGKGNGLPTTISAQRNASYDMETILAAPNFFRFALSLTDLVSEYLSIQTPRMYSLNAFWASRKDGVHFGTQAWHRDYDDSRFLALFMYGTDIWDQADGPHQYQIGTHLTAEEGDAIETMYGPAGTLFLADTRGIHRGLPPQRDPRLLIWCRWGVSTCPRSYIIDKLAPVPRSKVPDYPEDERLRESIRLVTK